MSQQQELPVFKISYSPSSTKYEIKMLYASNVYRTGTIRVDQIEEIKKVLDAMLAGNDVEGCALGEESYQWLLLGVQSDDEMNQNGIYMVFVDELPVGFYHKGVWFSHS